MRKLFLFDREHDGLGLNFGQSVINNGLTHNELAKKAVQAMGANLI